MYVLYMYYEGILYLTYWASLKKWLKASILVIHGPNRPTPKEAPDEYTVEVFSMIILLLLRFVFWLRVIFWRYRTRVSFRSLLIQCMIIACRIIRKTSQTTKHINVTRQVLKKKLNIFIGFSYKQILLFIRT